MGCTVLNPGELIATPYLIRWFLFQHIGDPPIALGPDEHDRIIGFDKKHVRFCLRHFLHDFGRQRIEFHILRHGNEPIVSGADLSFGRDSMSLIITRMMYSCSAVMVSWGFGGTTGVFVGGIAGCAPGTADDDNAIISRAEAQRKARTHVSREP